MKIAFVTECDYTIESEALSGCDLVIFPFFTRETVGYNREIKGITNFFRTLTSLSSRLKATIVAGCDTDSYGFIRHSAAVCDKGKLLGISDMTVIRDGDKYTGGGALRVYDTHAGKTGVAVGADALSSECVKTLALCGADIIVNVSDGFEDGAAIVSARAKAYEFGVPIAICAYKNAALAGTDGNMIFTSPQKITTVNLKAEKDYHLITLRRRGKRRKGDRI